MLTVAAPAGGVTVVLSCCHVDVKLGSVSESVRSKPWLSSSHITSSKAPGLPPEPNLPHKLRLLSAGVTPYPTGSLSWMPQNWSAIFTRKLAVPECASAVERLTVALNHLVHLPIAPSSVAVSASIALATTRWSWPLSVLPTSWLYGAPCQIAKFTRLFCSLGIKFQSPV